ncbi:hypothetical protein F5Y10DRAFT_266809 [Nemania abortiva]|nr:hypothetical protein F5Y10DRAFT_266809 [Nemania abortiva]
MEADNSADTATLQREIQTIKQISETLMEVTAGAQKCRNELLDQLKALSVANSQVRDTAYTLNERLDASSREAGSIVEEKYKLSFQQIRPFILSQLEYDSNMAGADVANNYILGTSLSREDQERSVFVINSSQLQDWIQAEGSTALVINGNAQRVARKTGLSLVCARLIHALDELHCSGGSSIRQPEIITIHFFCGNHDTGEETWESPRGIMNSLLAQLLTQCKHVDITKSIKPRKVDSDDLRNVFSWFRTVFRRLPANITVFCVLDDISVYVDNSYEKDAKFLISNLLKLSREHSSRRASLKILLTAPCWLRMSSSELGEVSTLSVTRPLPNTGGFSAMKWDMTVGKQLSESFGSRTTLSQELECDSDPCSGDSSNNDQPTQKTRKKSKSKDSRGAKKSKYGSRSKRSRAETSSSSDLSESQLSSESEDSSSEGTTAGEEPVYRKNHASSNKQKKMK